MLARSERFELPTLGFEVRGSSRARFRGFSHFGDVRIFLKSGAKGEAADESPSPGGLRVSGHGKSYTGFQQKSAIRKMGKPVALDGGGFVATYKK